MDKVVLLVNKTSNQSLKVWKLLKTLLSTYLIILVTLSGCSKPDPQTSGRKALAEAICTYEKKLKKGTEDFVRCVQ